jgi:hypothetical protein
MIWLHDLIEHMSFRAPEYDRDELRTLLVFYIKKFGFYTKAELEVILEELDERLSNY